MAGLWGRLALLLLVVCSVSLSAASDVDALQGLDQDFSSRKLLQAVAPTPSPETPAAPAPTPSHKPAPAPPVKATTSTETKTYLAWIGTGAAILVLVSIAVFCICRKCGQARIRGAQRLPTLPRYH